MTHMRFRVNVHSVVALMWRNFLLETVAISQNEVSATAQFGQFGKIVDCLFMNEVVVDRKT